ncbi:YjjG family noncanonical pyrimidine nucleotidase [Enterococcus sp. LJL98]
MTYTTLLFDVDDTLLDFQAAEKSALQQLFAAQGLPYTPENVQRYKEINDARWLAFEQGSLSRDEVVNGRFGAFFQTLGQVVDSPALEQEYRHYLNQGHQLLGDSLTVIQRLAETHHLYVVTNGVSKTQYQRLGDAGFLPYFKEVIVSEDTGYQKPMIEFFDYTFAKIPHLDKKKTAIIGDSLSSDIQGGKNAGIATIWLAPAGTQNTSDIQPTHQIQCLEELYEILS